MREMVGRGIYSLNKMVSEPQDRVGGIFFTFLMFYLDRSEGLKLSQQKTPHTDLTRYHQALNPTNMGLVCYSKTTVKHRQNGSTYIYTTSLLKKWVKCQLPL
jgi:hypothetical protein